VSARRLAVAALVAAAAVVLAPATARAQSPVLGSVELTVGNYRPNVDSDYVPKTPTSPATGTYERAFGTKRPLEFSLLGSKALWRGFGTFEAGLGVGFFRQSGHGEFAEGPNQGQPSTDKTTFSIVPTSLALTYRFDVVMDRWNVPIVPFARASLERYNWWITGGSGSTTMTGATNGYSYGGGLGLVLDFFDPMLARELDSETGVNHTMLVVEFKKTVVDDFGSKESWDLSDTRATLSFGLNFVF